jgi:hypothetical protein
LNTLDNAILTQSGGIKNKLAVTRHGAFTWRVEILISWLLMGRDELDSGICC